MAAVRGPVSRKTLELLQSSAQQEGPAKGGLMEDIERGPGDSVEMKFIPRNAAPTYRTAGKSFFALYDMMLV